jgi:hypothetical protein
VPVLLSLLLLRALDAAPAARPDSALLRAEALYGEAQYAESIAALDGILARRDLPPDERREATLYLGMGHLALGHEEAARARFREVLLDAPGYALPRYTSPKIRRLFDEVRAELEAAPRLAALPPRTTAAAAGPDLVELRFGAERLRQNRALVRFRVHGQGPFASAPLSPTNSGELVYQPPLGALAPAPTEDFDLEYYAEIDAGGARSGEVLARAGSAEQPLSVHVRVRGARAAAEPTPGGPPFYRRFWFWGVVGAVAAGTVVVLVRASGGGPETGALDIRFQVQP